MADKSRSRSRRRAQRMRRRRLLLMGGAVLCVALAVALALLLRRPGADTAALPSPEPVSVIDEAAPVDVIEAAEPDAESASTDEPQTPAPAIADAAPTEAPTPEPSPTPTALPGARPDVLSFYRPQDKSYSPRVRMGDSYTGPWKKGVDIGSFEVVASDAERLEGDFFGDIFGAAWTVFPDAGNCKIGYTLRYALDDGREIRYTMLSPNHIEHTEYIECWLYDDYHVKPHKFYSHLKGSSMKDETLITSIKLTAGKEIGHVADIWLTAFVCASLDDFDADRNYIGPTSCTIHILKK